VGELLWIGGGGRGGEGGAATIDCSGKGGGAVPVALVMFGGSLSDFVLHARSTVLLCAFSVRSPGGLRDRLPRFLWIPSD
jgi:hypothetical protein